MPKAPEDHKSPIESFVWKSPDGKKIKLKPFTKLPIGVFRRVANAESSSDGDFRSTFALLEAGTDAAGLAVLDEQPLDALEDIFTQWTEAGGVESPGES